ncbi:hypothetical protein, partial [Succinivibrio sp.]|uniref:hypothetical protein n=1 Tax=Succinivibrio sp. TaxID=2053619 RepID=UPI0025838CF8
KSAFYTKVTKVQISGKTESKIPKKRYLNTSFMGLVYQIVKELMLTEENSVNIENQLMIFYLCFKKIF